MARATSAPILDTPSETQDAEVQSALRLFVILTRAQAAIGAHAIDDIKADGLSMGEFGVLEFLYHKGPTLLGEIQRGVLVSSGGITFLIDRLAEKGLVERRDCPTDRRACYAALTREGDKLLKRIFPRHARRIATAMSGLSAGEQREAAELLKRIGLRAAELSNET